MSALDIKEKQIGFCHTPDQWDGLCDCGTARILASHHGFGLGDCEIAKDIREL